MFCTSCGAEILDGTIICPQCGVPTNSIQTTTAAPGSKKAPKSVGGFICSLLGFLLDWFPLLGLILSIVGVTLCCKGKAEVAKDPQAYTGAGMLTAGQVLGIIGIVVGSITLVSTLVWCIILGNGGFFSVMEEMIDIWDL